jgi:hypothetical protein
MGKWASCQSWKGTWSAVGGFWLPGYYAVADQHGVLLPGGEAVSPLATLFARVRRRFILGTSPNQGSRNFA